MNVDVSPDGRTIAFDLLGDIYTMPIAGGTPPRISSGLAFDMQPRFSPDGRLIAFTSDRGGGDNIWVMNADGTGVRADHERDLPSAERADLEPGRPLYRGAQAFHDAALARHRRDLALPRLRRRRRRRPGRAAQPAVPEGTRRAGLRAERPVHLFQPQHHARQQFRICAGFEPAGVRDRALRHGDRRAQHDRRRARRRGPPDALAGRTLARLRPPHRRRSRGCSSATCARASSARSMPISTRICRRPGRCTASIRTWPGPRTRTASCSGRAARSGG